MRPFTFEESSELVLKNENTLQECIKDFQVFTTENLLRINSKKSQVISFNLSHKYRFPAEIHVSQGEMLKVVTTAKILGVIISNDLKWSSNTEHITSKAKQKLWTLRKLSKMGFDDNFIIDVYCKEVRSILEYCAPVWSGGLTMRDSNKIENIQKSFLKILIQASILHTLKLAKGLKYKSFMRGGRSYVSGLV